MADVVAEAALWTVSGSTQRRKLRDGYIIVSPDPDAPAKDDGTPWWQWDAFKAGEAGRTIPAARQRYFRTAADARVHAGVTAGDQIVTRYSAASSPGDAITRVGRSLTSRDPLAATGVALHPDDIPARERGRQDVYRVRFGTCFTATGPALVREATRAAGRSPEPPGTADPVRAGHTPCERLELLSPLPTSPGPSSDQPDSFDASGRGSCLRPAAAARRHGGTLLAVSVSNKLNRDEGGAVPAAAALAFGELMAAGARAALSAGGGAAEAAAAVRAAVLPLWPKAVPEAARDVLVACADLAVTRHRVTAVPGELEPGPDLGHGGLLIASDMLELTVTWDADGRPGGLTLPLAYASSSAFDRDDEPAVLEAACVLIALAHPATGPSPAPGTSP